MASTSNPHISYNYDVFLSFRGKDTRNTFTGHLYDSLDAYGIRTFRDDEELEKGGDIASDLQRAIEESKIFIVILSRNYADSKWCLNELVKIIDCMTKKGSMVWPVFYHVDPRDVRNQGGSFGDAFLRHAKDADEEKEKTIEMWKEALKTAGKLSGHHLENQSEAELVQKIREEVIAKLNRKPLHVGDNIIAMDFHLEQLKPLIKTELDEVHMVGIFGPGGIGKTTISMAIYNHISPQFDGASFLKNVGGQSEAGLVELQKTILQDILKCKKPEFNNINEGINVMKERLQSKRVLIVLDDVDEYTQLETLGRKHGCYGAKTVIIITTRNQHLLDQHEVRAQYRYDVRKLNDEQSTKVFNWWAFKQNTPIVEFESLSKSVVKYADGLPIALKVLGGLFCNMSEVGEWESQLNQLQEIPDMTIQKVLKASYDKLGPMEREIFLDIAFFFRGEKKESVIRILGSKALNGIRVLHLRCLITISENKLDMHDLLQQIGREIVREECPDEAGERSRLWDPTDVQSVLTRNSGTKMIKGIFIGGSTLHNHHLQLSRDSFTRINKLRFLKVDNTQFRTINFKVDLPMDFELSSFELTYLQFENYPLESLPRNFKANNLVELNLQSSKIKRLWKENEVLHNLKVINLGNSKHLVEMADFATVPNLEILMLYGCSRLENLPLNFDKLQHLQILDCAWCSKLKSFPQIQGNMSKLREINLSWTAILEVPSSIGLLNGLESLDLRGCANLESLPSNFDKLQHLQSLDCSGCQQLKSFPQIKGNMSKLRKIDLSGTAIEELPSSIGHLKALQSLELSGCRNLENLPDSICDLRSLETLDVLNCSKLEKLKVQANENEFLTCAILKPGVVWRDDLFFSFKTLNLQYCNQMEAEAPNSSNHHLLSLSSLVELFVRNTSLYRDSIISTDGFNFYSLEVVSEGNFNPMMTRGIFKDIFLQSSLWRLTIRNCNLMDIGIIPTNIWNLPSLVTLSLSYCNLREGDILNRICHLSSLEQLSLEGNHFSSIPASINRLSNLKGLNLSHCKQLQDIPELPSTLLFLDALCSDSISSSPSLLSLHSQFNRFVSKLTQETHVLVGASWFKGMGMSIVIPRSSTILKMMVMNPSMGSDEVTIKLPRNWYENNDLLGFAICCCVCVPKSVDDEDKEEDEAAVNLQCHLTISRNNQSKAIDSLSFCSWCAPCEDSGLSDQILWVIYYPKDAIKEKCRSNEWTHLTASFCCCGRCIFDWREHYCRSFRAWKDNGTGFHLIYSEEHQQSQDDDENKNISRTEGVKRRRMTKNFTNQRNNIKDRENPTPI